MIFLQSVELTERQKECYDFICDYIKQNGYAPSLREISKGIYCSKPVAQRHLCNLIDKGYVKYTPRTARSIVILKQEALSI